MRKKYCTTTKGLRRLRKHWRLCSALHLYIRRLCPRRQAFGICWKCAKAVELSWRNNLCELENQDLGVWLRNSWESSVCRWYLDGSQTANARWHHPLSVKSEVVADQGRWRQGQGKHMDQRKPGRLPCQGRGKLSLGMTFAATHSSFISWGRLQYHIWVNKQNPMAAPRRSTFSEGALSLYPMAKWSLRREPQTSKTMMHRSCGHQPHRHQTEDDFAGSYRFWGRWHPWCHVQE